MGLIRSLFFKFNVLFYKIPLVYIHKFTKTLFISLQSICFSFRFIFDSGNEWQAVISKVKNLVFGFQIFCFKGMIFLY